MHRQDMGAGEVKLQMSVFSPLPSQTIAMVQGCIKGCGTSRKLEFLYACCLNRPIRISGNGAVSLHSKADNCLPSYTRLQAAQALFAVGQTLKEREQTFSDAMHVGEGAK